MGQYIFRRLVYMVPTFFVVITIVFLVLSVAPGDAVDILFSEASPSKEDKDRIRAEFNLDKPVYVQYGLWLANMARGNFGRSLQRNVPVLDLIVDRLPNSLRLGLMAFVVAWLISIPIGVISAVKAETWVDQLARTVAVILLAVPNFWLAVLVLVLPALMWGIAPSVEYVPLWVDPIKNLTYFIVPSLILGASLTGATMRMTRSMMLEVLSADFIRTARAKGLTEQAVIYRHALKNALIPVITIIGTQTPTLVGGAVVIETIFAMPGMGQLLYLAIIGKDAPVVQAVVVCLSLFVLVVNLLVDLSYAFLDPRIRLN